MPDHPNRAHVRSSLQILRCHACMQRSRSERICVRTCHWPSLFLILVRSILIFETMSTRMRRCKRSCTAIGGSRPVAAICFRMVNVRFRECAQGETAPSSSSGPGLAPARAHQRGLQAWAAVRARRGGGGRATDSRTPSRKLFTAPGGEGPASGSMAYRPRPRAGRVERRRMARRDRESRPAPRGSGVPMAGGWRREGRWGRRGRACSGHARRSGI